MKNQHLTDTEIQQYALQKSNCEVGILQHIQNCPNCKMKAGQYSLLFGAISEQEKPIFEFNLADLVLERLPKHQQNFANENSFFSIIGTIAFFLFCILSYFFGKNLLDLFTGIKPILIGLIITTVTSILIFLLTDIYKKHQTQMQALNIY